MPLLLLQALPNLLLVLLRNLLLALLPKSNLASSMKIIQICSSVFLMIGLCTLGYADEHFPFQAQVSKESVNVRSGANTNYEKLDKLSQGAQVVVVGKSYDWYKVQLSSTAKAYVRADYLRINQNSTAELIGDKVNVRAAANSDATSLGVLKKGELVKVITQVNDWWQIEPPSSAVGWIRQDFLTAKSSKIDPSLIRKTPVEATVAKSLSTVEVKGFLKPLVEPKSDVRYELMVDGKPLYYIQSVPNLERFKGGVVLIKGVVISSKQPLAYPMLRVVDISLLL
jgi:uncharacterized protein YgiM (DUF1202 family)